MNNLLSSQNVVFKTYAFYSMLLVLKMFLMALLIVTMRLKKKAFISPEDTSLHHQAEVKYDDPDIERLRRAHLNDLENIPVFLVTGLFFVLANPNELLATTLFRLYAVFRLLHTVVYTMIVIRQPARSLMFTGGLIVNIIMAVAVIIKFFHM